MTILGADWPVAVLITTASVSALWAWREQARQARQVRHMVDWLMRHRGADWAALPWQSRVLVPRAGIAEMRRRGLANDPAFAALEAEARRLERRMLKLIGLAVAAMAAVALGVATLGWEI